MIESRCKLEDTIVYRFENLKLVKEALTHSSYANEKKSNKIRNNERLEFLGDSVLSIVISDYLFRNYPDLPEGELTKIRSKIVCEATLSDCARRIKLGNYMMFGRGEELTGGRERTSILADAWEALIAAIYLDAGLETAREFIMEQMSQIIEDAIQGKVFMDYKTRLQEVIQVEKSNRIRYELTGEEGPDHCKVFYSSVLLNDERIGEGKGRSKKESEQEAAKQALRELERRG
ncbi:MAG: ribonuclease III [Clostridia bacterium]|nr:ribonuclease III [Clostridia bacterium]